MAVAVGSFALADAAVLDPTSQLAVVNLAEPLVLCLCALMVLWMAFHFAPGEPLRRQWVPIGIGLLMFALGDLVYAANEMSAGGRPHSPGLPDALYALFYPLVAVGIVRAALGYRRLVRLRPLVVVSAGTGVGLMALVLLPFFRLAGPALAEDAPAAMVGLLFPAADVACVVVPALLMLLIALRMRGARLAAPWVAVALGGVLFAASDVWFLYQQWAGTYEGGHVTDAGWMVGAVLIALGASIAADINRVGQTARGRREEQSASGSSAPAAPTA